MGLPTGPDQIIITAGGHHALRVVFDVLAVPTAPVLVEEYTYGAVVDLAAARRAGLLIASGEAFHHRRARSGHVRICHDRPEALLSTAIAKLGAL
ncbi:hypothetical protein [Allorhizocola rhizosphaerae]|uniref:hypothetical protein n=1 Tax=Allorhizocola rhizosphaerae TaxID=1872709 RepID=UPI001FE63490|nr:hypothetical protein [Allorhizocola rhizosphaerae]